MKADFKNLSESFRHLKDGLEEYELLKFDWDVLKGKDKVLASKVKEEMLKQLERISVSLKEIQFFAESLDRQISNLFFKLTDQKFINEINKEG